MVPILCKKMSLFFYINRIVRLLLYFAGAGTSNENSGINNKSKPWRSTYTDELPLNDVNASASIDGKCYILAVVFWHWLIVTCMLYSNLLVPYSSLQSLIKYSVFIFSVCSFGPQA